MQNHVLGNPPTVGRRRRFSLGRSFPIVPTLLIILFAATATFADFLVLHPPLSINLPNRLAPPMWIEGGSLSYPLGTDELGRDILSRIIGGSRVSLLVALGAVLVGGTVGSVLGLIGGFLGGWSDGLIMRLTDATLSFPAILLALILAVVVGPSLLNIILVLGLVLWARYARLVRGEVLRCKHYDFVALARVAGCSNMYIVFYVVLPNVVSPIIVLSTLQMGWAIVVEASLSFLGAGIPPPNPSWGQMTASGQDFITRAWWLSVIPGSCIGIVVLAFNLFGDWLRDRMDPKQSQL